MIEEDIHKFLTASTVGKRTKENYRHYLLLWLTWLAREGRPFEDASAVEVGLFFEAHPNWANSTKYSALAAIRELYRFKLGADHPMLKARVKRVLPGPQRTLDEEEVGKLLAAIDTTTAKGIRDLAIITLMLDTGLRASEVVNAELKYLNMRKKKIQVLIKGGKWGDAIFFDYTEMCLSKWLGIRHYFADPEATSIFVSMKGFTPGTRMTRSGLLSLVKRIGKKAGIDNISAHSLRRTFATLALENGASTRLVQKAGRWSDIRMVELYSQALKADKIAKYSVVNTVMGLQGPDV